MKLESKVRRVPTRYVKLGEYWFRQDDVIEALEELEGVNFPDAVLISPTQLGPELERLGAAKRNVRGSYAQGPALQEVLDAVYDAREGGRR